MVDANGQSLAYVYSRENASDANMAKVLTLDEARRIASNIAKLPTVLQVWGLHISIFVWTKCGSSKRVCAPMEKPRPRSTRLLRFQGGTSDGTGDHRHH